MKYGEEGIFFKSSDNREVKILHTAVLDFTHASLQHCFIFTISQ
jgi:hypothetical protein